MNRDFAGVTTVLTVTAIGAASYLRESGETGTAFVPTGGRAGGRLAQRQLKAAGRSGAQPAADGSLGLSSAGLVGYGMGFGVLTTVVRCACIRVAAGRRRVARRAEGGSDIQVAEKTETKPVSYLQNLPRTIIEPKILKKLLATVPKEQWENPPEDSYLYSLKCYAETYGPGKATKMSWWDYLWLRQNEPDEECFEVGREEHDAMWRKIQKTGELPLQVPGPGNFIGTDVTFKWRGPEPFAGDQIQVPVRALGFSRQFVNNWAFYREGLKPWQRGIEIGMAHGYWLIGPFVFCGPLRDTPEAATVGLLDGCAIIGLVSVGALLFGTVLKPPIFDKEGDKPGAGFIELINWHAVGGLGGAGFAHALLTVFGS